MVFVRTFADLMHRTYRPTDRPTDRPPARAVPCRVQSLVRRGFRVTTALVGTDHRFPTDGQEPVRLNIMATTRISTPAGSLPGYLASPAPAIAGDGPWPGVVIVHDISGLGDDIRMIADRFATAGYLALVPDMYARGGFARCVRSVFRDLRRAHGRSFDDIDAARQALVERADCTGKVGIAGFCLGGGFAIIGASRGFDASAPYYGMLPADESILDDACPVVASFGGKDRSLPGATAKLESALTEREIPHDVKEYPDAGHSFANRSLGPLDFLARITGFGYHHDEAEDAWKRVLTFFAEHLRSPE